MPIRKIFHVVRDSLKTLVTISLLVVAVLTFITTVSNRARLTRVQQEQQDLRRETSDWLLDHATVVEELTHRVRALEEQVEALQKVPPTPVKPRPVPEAWVQNTIKEIRARLTTIERWRLQELGRGR